MKHRVFAAIVLLFLMVTISSAVAEETYAGQDHGTDEILQPTNPEDFSIEEMNDGTARITKYNGTDEVIVIPAEIQGRIVTEIGDKIFGYYNFVSSVTLPQTILRIGDCSFQSCQMLQEINIPDSVVSIGAKAFDGCEELTRINLPDGVSQIGDFVFNDCSALEQVNIPEGITRIPQYAFCGCVSLTELIIPDSVTEIGDSAFFKCKSLTRIELPKGIFSISAGTFSWCDSLEEIIIPEGVVSIGGSAFDGCHALVNVEIPDSVRFIGGSAFRECSSLTGIVFPEDVSFGGGVFPKCTSLRTFRLPKNMTVIPEAMFLECSSLQEILIPEDCETIERHAFAGCTSLDAVRLPDRLKVLGEECFKACTSLQSIRIPAGIQTIEDGVYYGNASLTEVVLPDSLRFIPSYMFSRCTSLKSICLPEGIEYIDSSAFAQCFELSTLDLPSSLHAFDNTCFDGCDHLKEVRCFPGSYAEIWAKQNSISVIGKEGTPQNTQLATIYMEQDQDGRTVITGCGAGNLLVFPFNSRQDGSYSIAANAFANNTELEYVVFMGNCREVGESAFQGCTSLKTVSGHMPSVLKSYAFASCSSLTSLPPGINFCRSIENWAFSECRSLRFVNIDGVNGQLGCEVFGHCDALEEAYINVNIEDIHEDRILNRWTGGVLWHEVFLECPNLRIARISGFAQTMPRMLFRDCPKLEIIQVPRCKRVDVDTVNDPSNVIALGCPSLKYVYVKNLEQPDAQPRLYPEGVQIIPEEDGNAGTLTVAEVPLPSPLPAPEPKEDIVIPSEQDETPVLTPVLTVAPTPETVSTATPAPKQEPTAARTPDRIVLGGSLPKNHALNQLNEDTTVSFTLTLYSDGNARLDEGYPEGYFNYSGKWSMKDNHLVLKLDSPSTALENRIPVSNGIIHFNYFGERIDRELTSDEEAFLNGSNGTSSEPANVSSAQLPGTDLQNSNPVDLGSGLHSVPVFEVTADSWIEGKDPSAYIPARMTDGDEHTAWQFSTAKSKLKETYAYFAFDTPQDVDALWIKNGFWKVTNGLDQYTRNSRVKELGIAFRYDDSNEWTDKMTVKLKDDKSRQDWQKIDLGEHKQIAGIRFRIMSIYKGTKFPKDVCISEVMFVQKN